MRELMGVALVLGLAAPALGQVPVTPAHRLAWDQAAHVAEQITRFELKIDGSLWGSVGVPTPTDMTFTVPLTKVPNGPHTLSVRACNVLGCGDPGPSVTVTMSGQASTPITPTHTLQWEQTDYASVTRFELDLDSAAKWGDIGKPPVSGATVTAPMPTMTTGKHTIAVRACNATGCGPASGLLTVDMAAPVPTTPSNLRATPKAGG
jgi:hypothetical protein